MFHALERRCEQEQVAQLFPNILNENVLIDALENTETLKGHGGCVNTLRWNRSGALLASGSDDRHVKIWRAGVEKVDIETQHEGNVFAVEFLPSSNDRVLVTGAADHVIFMHDLETNTAKRWDSEGRIKRICTVQQDPFLFWAASEYDKRVIELDTRIGDPVTVVQPGPTNPHKRHVKSVAVSEAKPNLLAVGFDETAVRLYDRRKFDEPILSFAQLDAEYDSYHATHVAFNKLGTEVVVNQGHGGGVFVFSLDSSKDPNVMQRMHNVLGQPRETTIYSAALPHPELRQVGSDAIKERHFSRAIDYYAQLIRDNYPDRAFRSICHSNRAMAFLLRRSRGDTYACIRESVKALEIHRGNTKALFRLIKSLSSMEHVVLAKKCLETYKQWFPNDQGVIDRLTEEIAQIKESDGQPELQQAEGSVDYVQRFTGSTNHQTDIKEANFFGSRDQFIVAGSDCGHMYIWSRDTSKLLGIWKADDHILNICQPHPDLFLLATSGIEDDIRLWSPQLERADEYVSRKVADPYEFMEKKSEMGGFNAARTQMQLLGLMRESPQCVQS
ncbi:unnamed protein product [Caenorhabditis sp. 36 PRJEB53466]|nr:unnamed protein product [Caenorhabditis sp. 36 PRJEB53466]